MLLLFLLCGRAAAGELFTCSAREPVFVPMRVGSIADALDSSSPRNEALRRRLAEEARQTARTHPGRMITLQLVDLPLEYGQLGEEGREHVRAVAGDLPDPGRWYAQAVSSLLMSVVREQRAAGVPLIAACSLPLERSAGGAAWRVNAWYEPLLGEMDALVVARSLVLSKSADEPAWLRRAIPQALAMADDRPVFYRVNRVWRAALPHESLRQSETWRGELAAGDEDDLLAERIGPPTDSQRAALGESALGTDPGLMFGDNGSPVGSSGGGGAAGGGIGSGGTSGGGGGGGGGGSGGGGRGGGGGGGGAVMPEPPAPEGGGSGGSGGDGGSGGGNGGGGGDPGEPVLPPGQEEPFVGVFTGTVMPGAVDYVQDQGGEMVIIFYSWHIDPGETGTVDLERLEQFVLERVPEDEEVWCCLDMEGPYLDGLYAPPDSAAFQHTVSQMLLAIELAKSLRPEAKWSFWGLPWLKRLIPDSNGFFWPWQNAPPEAMATALAQARAPEALWEEVDWYTPSVYDAWYDDHYHWWYVETHNAWAARRIGLAMELAEGRPVIPSVTPRVNDGEGAVPEIQWLLPDDEWSEQQIVLSLASGADGVVWWGADFVFYQSGTLPPHEFDWTSPLPVVEAYLEDLHRGRFDVLSEAVRTAASP